MKGPLRILVMDDKAFVRTMTGLVLKNEGFQDVSFAASGAEALSRLQREPAVDVLFCDLDMPDMDGIEVVRHISLLQRQPMIFFVSGLEPALLQTVLEMARGRGLRVLGAHKKPLTASAIRQVLGEAPGERGAAAAPVNLPVSGQEVAEALERRELVLYYQPKVDIETRRVTGFEALARWRHPRYGLVLPDLFIEPAGQAGLLRPFTDRIISMALGQCAAWNKAVFTTRISVNLPASLLVDVGMPDRIAREAEQSGVAAHQVVFEITETGLVGDSPDTLEILGRLHLKGFGLSIDDFGTGYSSMDQLRRIPFSELKIDRAFVHQAAGNSKALAILNSSAALGRSLGLSVVGEGAETKDDWDILRAAGVDIAQGYFVAKPMPAEAVTPWASAWEAQRSCAQDAPAGLL